MIKGLHISLVVWDYYYARQQVLSSYISNHYKIDFLEPIIYSNKEKSLRLKRLSINKIPPNLSIIKRNSKLKKSFFFLLYENFLNLFFVIKNNYKFVISDNYLTSILVCIYCRIFNIFFVFDLIDDWSEVEKNIFTKFFWKYIAKNILFSFSSVITTTSKKQFNIHTKKHKNILYFPNGKLDIKKIAVKNDNKSIKKVIFIGTLRDWFDFDSVFNAFEKLPNVYLEIYGEGPIKKELKDKSKNIRNISIHDGVGIDKANFLLRNTDIGIIPLKNNKLNQSTNPIKLYDYWSLGKAVIATPTEELKLISGGSIFFASTSKEYFDAIKKLDTNYNYRYKLAKLGYEKVMNKYNYKIIGEKYVDLINRNI